MGDRARELQITFGNIGAGTVIDTVPPELLISPNETGVFSPSPTPYSKNVRLLNGEAQRRPGLGTEAGAGTGANTPITSLFTAEFYEGSRALLRGYIASSSGGDVQKYNENADSWTDLIGSDVGTALPQQPWAFAMTPNPSDSPPSVCLFANPTTSIYSWLGTGTATALADTNAPVGPYAMTAFISRAFALNVVNPLTGNRVHGRLQYSVVGDSFNWTGIGAGNIDLDNDPYPGVGMVEIGGRLAVFKGNERGGAIYICTPTGVTLAPLRVDAVQPDSNVGLLLPRSLTQIAPNVVFFVGHDGVYLYDGIRALLPFAEGKSRTLIDSINPKARALANAHYRPETNEVWLNVPTGTNKYPDTTWVFEIRSKRAWGPYSANSTGTTYGIPAQTSYATTDAYTWLTWPPATWNDVSEPQWRLIHGDDYGQTKYATAVAQMTLSETDNTVFLGDADATTEGSDWDINCEWQSPAITPDGWMIQTGPRAARTLRPDDMLTLREVALRHEASEDWVPIVEASIDGNSWTTISDGTTASDTNGRLKTITYYNGDTVGPSSWWQFRVKNSSGDKLDMRDLRATFTYSGSERHE